MHIMKIKIDNRDLTLHIIDTTSYGDYDYMTESIIRSSEGFIYVIDLKSKELIEKFFEFVGKVMVIKDVNSFPLVLFFNKNDLEENQIIIKEEDIQRVINKLEKEFGYQLPHFCGSAKNRMNIDEVFYEIVHQIDNNLKKIQLKMPITKK